MKRLLAIITRFTLVVVLQGIAFFVIKELYLKISELEKIQQNTYEFTLGDSIGISFVYTVINSSIFLFVSKLLKEISWTIQNKNILSLLLSVISIAILKRVNGYSLFADISNIIELVIIGIIGLIIPWITKAPSNTDK